MRRLISVKRFLFDLTVIVIFTVLVTSVNMLKNQPVTIFAIIVPLWAIGVCGFLMFLFMIEILAKFLAASFIWQVISKSLRDKLVFAVALVIFCVTLFIPLLSSNPLGKLAFLVPVLGAIAALITLRLFGTDNLSEQGRFFINS